LKFEVPGHPAYSPDLAPSNFHLFEPLKVAFRGHRFADDDEVKEEVHDRLHSFFSHDTWAIFNSLW
jgi:hypothetical protein